jgi:hypothetical protein
MTELGGLAPSQIRSRSVPGHPAVGPLPDASVPAPDELLGAERAPRCPAAFRTDCKTALDEIEMTPDPFSGHSYTLKRK